MAIPGEQRETATPGATNRHRLSGCVAESRTPPSIRLRRGGPDRPSTDYLAPLIGDPEQSQRPTSAARHMGVAVLVAAQSFTPRSRAALPGSMKRGPVLN